MIKLIKWHLKLTEELLSLPIEGDNASVNSVLKYVSSHLLTSELTRCDV